MMVQQLAQQDGSTTQNPQTSLVAMTSSLRKKRAETLSLVLALKRDSAKTIASAARLAIGNAASVSSERVSGSTEGGGSATASTAAAVDASKVINRNPTGVGVAAASSIGAKLSWKQDLGIKSTKKPRKKIRIKFSSDSSRSRSALEIKARKGL